MESVPPHPSYTQHNTTHNNTQEHYTTALRYIKLPMYQLFLWCLYIMVLRDATSLLGALEGENNRYINNYSKSVDRIRVHEHAISLRLLGII